MSENVKEYFFLYSDSWFDQNKNKVIFKAAINHIKNTERFSGSLWLMFHYRLMSKSLPIIQTT